MAVVSAAANLPTPTNKVKKNLGQWLEQNQWPKSLIRTEKFQWPVATKSIEYGNEKYGFFRKALAPGAREIKIFPPGYKYPIEFYALSEDGGRTKLGVRHYDNPFTHQDLSLGRRLKGQFSFPLMTSSWSIGGPDLSKMISFPAIFNREGELVWLTVAKDNDHFIHWSVIAEQLGDGQMAYLTRRKNGIFRVVNARGEIQREFRHDGEIDPLLFHHGFQYLKESNEALVLAFDCQELTRRQEFAPLFSGLKGLWNLWQLPRRTYLGSKLVKINLQTGDFKIIWRSEMTFNIQQDYNLALISDGMDRFLDARSVNQYMAILNSPTLDTVHDGIKCDAEWTHENSARYYPGQGYLISVRNLNRVIMLGEDFKLLWSIGQGDESTNPIQPYGQGFSMQHDAWLLDKNRILLFNNNIPYRGFLGKRRLNSLQIIRLEKQHAVVDWQYQIPSAPSTFRGSVTPLPNKNFFAYIPGTWGMPYRYIEVDPSKNVERASLKLNKEKDFYRSIEARPAWTIDGDSWHEAGAPRKTSNDSSTPPDLGEGY